MAGFESLGNKTAKAGADSALIREMLDAVNLVEILENEYGLVLEEGSNGWLTCHCPMPGHNERTPSFGVNPATGKYNCFGCGEHGNLLDFVRAVDGSTFGEALQRVAEWSGIDPNGAGASDAARALRDIRQMTRAFLDMHAETKLPGGVSESQFFRLLATRLKEHLAKFSAEPDEVAWVDSMYAEADLIDADNKPEEGQKKLAVFWSLMGQRIAERESHLEKRKETEPCHETPETPEVSSLANTLSEILKQMRATD